MDHYKQGNGLRFLLRMLSFILFGVMAFSNPLDLYNPYNMIFGGIIGLFFGFLCRLFLICLLRAFNSQLSASMGKKTISIAVSRSMLFVLPFTIMALFSYYCLGWFMTAGFMSAGIMSAAASASMEIGKLKGKQEIKNTAVSSLVAAAFSSLWIYGTTLLGGVPGIIEGLVGIVLSQSRHLF